jgi:mannose-6-phosphate isomerase-like protein (cupin superfamily)
MHETIRVGSLSVTFLKTRHETGGAFDLFELTIPPLAHAALPHIHRDYDETIFGLDGVMTWTLRDKAMQIQQGDMLSIPRGTPHFYENRHHTPGRILCLQTPGVMGQEYYREIAAILRSEGSPDLSLVSAVMGRYGVIPVSHDEHLTSVKSPAMPEHLHSRPGV